MAPEKTILIWDPILSSTSAFKIRRDAMISALSTSITSGTTPSAAFLNHIPVSLSVLSQPYNNLLKAAICVLTLTLFGKRGLDLPRTTCRATTSCTMAPLSIACLEPVPKVVDKPDTKWPREREIGLASAVVASVTPER